MKTVTNTLASLSIISAMTLTGMVAPAEGDVVLRTGTNDAMELDFDGAGTETNGSLLIPSMTFVLTGGDIPGTTEFANISSITLQFLADDAALSARNTAGPSSGGLGVDSGGESAANEILLNQNTGESLRVLVSSTSTNGTDFVTLNGVQFASWRTVFPVSQADFSGATVGGNSFYTGADGSSAVTFDTGTNDWTVFSASHLAAGGGDPIRLHSISLGVSAVPEPSGLAVFVGLGMLLIGRRRKRPVRI